MKTIESIGLVIAITFIPHGLLFIVMALQDIKKRK